MYLACFICRKVAAAIGAGYVLHSMLRHLHSISNGFRAYFLAPRGIGRTELRNYGTWAGTSAK